ncbi:FmdB family zinc ribbon protein [Paraburkholderia phenazinium]|uniref:Putative regulatory protein, FmdB family n=1 Tax=Paraburkholderia phenazinium TaxID=60549 RepID=A0A1G7X1N3_9BURK|nr:FmdB family zinc ribbon protein [Paraburkholderia phenazinium]SDG78103.1 putative regulatory protein, FmdB family [Paraburkholderia phenazinium]
MPIYAYRCESCGFGKDVLQKMSDAPLTNCPECGKDSFRKQVTAAGFQLKGSGWYVTDFRGGNSASGAAAPNGANGDKAAASAKTEGGSAEAGAASSSASTAESSSSAAAAPAAPAAATATTSGSGSA